MMELQEGVIFSEGEKALMSAVCEYKARFVFDDFREEETIQGVLTILYRGKIYITSRDGKTKAKLDFTLMDLPELDELPTPAGLLTLNDGSIGFLAANITYGKYDYNALSSRQVGIKDMMFSMVNKIEKYQNKIGIFESEGMPVI